MKKLIATILFACVITFMVTFVNIDKPNKDVNQTSPGNTSSVPGINRTTPPKGPPIPIRSGLVAPTPTVSTAAEPTTTEPTINTKDRNVPEVVLAKAMVPNLVEDLKYATTNNFMHQKLYNFSRCYLPKDVAEGLSDSSNYLTGMKPGYRLKVWDCYRPMEVQQEMWNKFPNTPYVSDPKNAKHPRGLAVDITIVDTAGNELEMPTGFDDFSSRAYPSAPASKAATENRRLLQKVMAAGRFVPISSEWWHFEFIG